MAFSTEIQSDDGAKKFLVALGVIESDDTRKSLHGKMASRLANMLKRHFVKKNAKPNKLGGAKTNFWVAIAGATSDDPSQTTAEKGVVVIGDRRFALQYFGGTVVPREAKVLTIPIHPAAHGKRVSELRASMPDVRFFTPKGKSYIAANIGGQLKVFYLLRKSATIPRDPEATPPEEALQEGMLKTAKRFMRRLANGGGTA